MQQRKLEKRLIVNADDFGLHSAVNEAVIKGHISGCITSTSIMISGRAWKEAAELAKEYPSLGVGVHLTLVGGERPVLDPALISSLVDNQGLFPADYTKFIKLLLQGKIKLAEVRNELAAQLDRAAASGINITHVDSHQHLHIFPAITDIVLDLAATRGIRALRIPNESLLFTGGYPFTVGRMIGKTGLTLLAKFAKIKAGRRGFVFPEAFFGMLAGGNMSEKYLQNIVKTLPSATSEIMVHPGADDSVMGKSFTWNYNWQSELNAVTSKKVLESLAEQGVKLISFRELQNG